MSPHPDPDPGADDQDPWTAQAVRDDVTAALHIEFSAFYLLRHKTYLRYAHLQLGNRPEAEQAVHDTFVALAHRWRRTVLLQPDVEAYAVAMLKAEVARVLAIHGRGTALVQTAAFAALRAHSRRRLAALESGIGLYSAIARLPERQFDVIVLHHVLGKPQIDVARLMGIDYATVRSHLRGARRRLAQELGVDWPITKKGSDDEPGD